MEAIIRRSTGSTIKDVLKSRWMSVAASLLIMACNGTIYAFGIYSQNMKLTLGYTQHQLTTIGLFKDLGANFGLVAGILQDYTNAWIVIVLGSILNIVGSVMIWLGLTERISSPKVWQMCLYHFVCFNSQAFVNTAVIVTGIRNFPGNRGMVLGLVKGFVGLSGAILAQIYRAIYGNNPTSFVILILWLPTTVYLTFMFFIRPVANARKGNETRRFSLFLGSSVFLALYLLVVIVVQKLTKVSHRDNVILAVLELLILLLPLCIVFYTTFQDRNQVPDQNIRTNLEEDADDRKSNHKKLKENNTNTAIAKGDDHNLQQESTKWILSYSRPRVRRGENHSVLEALLGVEFWMLFIMATSALGSGNMALDNVGQLTASLGYASLQTNTFISLISIWNFFGRISAGFASEFALRHYKVPRPFFLSLSLASLCVGHLLFAFAVPGAVYIGSILVGFGYGFQSPILFIIISEIFGLRFFGTLYNVATLALPLGTQLLSVMVGGDLYDKEAEKQQKLQPQPTAKAADSRKSHDQVVCVGKQCFRNAFLIMAGVCAFGCLLGLTLSFRTRKFYEENAIRLTSPPELDENIGDEEGVLELPHTEQLHH